MLVVVSELYAVTLVVMNLDDSDETSVHNSASKSWSTSVVAGHEAGSRALTPIWLR